MKKTRTLFIAALAAFSLSPLTAQAQDAPAAETQSAHSRLYAAMESGVDQEQVLTISATTVASQILAGAPPEVRDGNPGMQAALASALREPMRVYSERITAENRPLLVAAIAEVMTDDESTALADFYSSELGQRVLLAASANLSVDNMAQDGAADATVDAASVEQDMNETGMRTFGALSEEDQADLMRISLTTPGFAKMPVLQSQLAPIRAQMESTPPTAEEGAAIQAAIFEVMEQFAP